MSVEPAGGQRIRYGQECEFKVAPHLLTDARVEEIEDVMREEEEDGRRVTFNMTFLNHTPPYLLGVSEPSPLLPSCLVVRLMLVLIRRRRG